MCCLPLFFLLRPLPLRSTLFPTRRSSDLQRRRGEGPALRGGGRAARARIGGRLPGVSRAESRARPGGRRRGGLAGKRSEEHTSELQSLRHLVCRPLLDNKKAHTRLLIFKC